MDSREVEVDTAGGTVFDITGAAASFCRGRGTGWLNVFAPHATAGLALMEVGAGSEQDLARLLGELMARDGRWAHRHGSAGHGADHLLPALLSPSLVIPVEGGEMSLGTWQSLVLVDTNVDNSRRRVRFSFMPS